MSTDDEETEQLSSYLLSELDKIAGILLDLRAKGRIF
jgi:hypothetical protein